MFNCLFYWCLSLWLFSFFLVYKFAMRLDRFFVGLIQSCSWLELTSLCKIWKSGCWFNNSYRCRLNYLVILVVDSSPFLFFLFWVRWIMSGIRQLLSYNSFLCMPGFALLLLSDPHVLLFSPYSWCVPLGFGL